jgi:toxin ParE1/3/4
MTLLLVLRPQAQAEFADAAIWYEAQRAGLGHKFVSEVEKTLDNIADQPDRYAIAHGDIREAPVLRFPYVVYYRIKPKSVVVIAVFHSARDPAIWQTRR